MRRFLTLAVAALFALTFGAFKAQATTIDYTGSTLHGSTGSLTINDLGGGDFTVLWSIDFTGFVGDATHQYLTNVSFKAFSSGTISLDDASIGSLYYPSNVNNGGCDISSPSDSACVTLTPKIDATAGGTFSVLFNVSNGTLIDEDSWNFRGKYGDGNGWVISESAPPVPEPTAALIFGLGALVVGSASRRTKL